MWNKTELTPEGTCRVTARNPPNRRKYSSEFVAVNKNLALLLDARVMQQTGLIEVHEETFEKVAAVKVPLPVIDEVLPDLSHAKLFTYVVARNVYWHVQLDNESTKLMTFNTPYGR